MPAASLTVRGRGKGERERSLREPKRMETAVNCSRHQLQMRFGNGHTINKLLTLCLWQEEKEAVYSVRAKLFFKKSSDSEFTELGLGQLRVLPGSGEGVRVLMRNDTSLGKVCLAPPSLETALHPLPSPTSGATKCTCD